MSAPKADHVGALADPRLPAGSMGAVATELPYPPTRPPQQRHALRAEELSRALRDDGLWSAVRVVAETGSTNADVADLARAGAPEGLVLIAESQRAGRGRMGRSWHAPPRTSLTLSVLFRPRDVAPAALGWLPLLAGVAAVQACGVGVDAALKWPNDLLVRPQTPARDAGTEGWGKCGGILAEAVEPGGTCATCAIVVGIGINVCQTRQELVAPIDAQAYPATSLAVAGAHRDRHQVALGLLRGLSQWYGRWLAAGGDAEQCGLQDAYRRVCLTLGRAVSVLLPGGGRLQGTATDIDAHGRLVVATMDGERALAAGDVHHLRPADDPPVQGR